MPVYARDGLSNPSPGGWIWRSSRSKVRLLPLLFEKIPSNDGSSPGHIQARLAAPSSVRVPRFCLHYPRGFRQLLALSELFTLSPSPRFGLL